MKKYISFLLAGVMTLSATASVFAADFSDIKDVPWPGVETYINQVADNSLMVGENIDGKMFFRAKDPVTLVETAQLVYNLLKATNHLENQTDTAAKWDSVLKEAKIPEWAYTSVSYCLETGVITDAEAKAFMSGTTSVQATREQVAGMIGKAIAGVDSSASSSSTSTKFGDNSSIAADKVPYIALLSEKSILSGDDLGNFNPKNKINRAEMAVMMTKSNDVLKSVTNTPAPTTPETPSTTTPSTTTPSTTTPSTTTPSTTTPSTTTPSTTTPSTTTPSTTTPPSGGSSTTPSTTTPNTPSMPTVGTFTAQIEQVQAQGDNKMLALYNGTQVMGYIGDNTVPTTYQDGTEGTFGDVTVGTSVTITYDGARITKMIINTAPPKKDVVPNEVLKGDLANLSRDEIRIVKGQPHYFASNVDITINGKSKTVRDLIDEFDDKDVDKIEVELTLDSKGDVTKVIAKTKEKSYEDSGTIKKLTKSKITFENGSDYKINEKDVTVKFDGSSSTLEKAISKINEADKDDKFTADVDIDKDDDDYVERIEIKSKSSSSSKSGSGTIKSVSGKKITVGSKSYTLTSDTTIDIDDGDTTIKKIADLETAVEDDDKTIEVDVTVKNDEVTKVKGYVSSVKGELYSVDRDEVTLNLDSGKFTYECKSSVDISAGKCDDMDELEEYNKDQGRIEVELTINSSNQVTKIKER